MKKILSLLMLALISIGTAWAETTSGTEVLGFKEGRASNDNIIGESVKIDGNTYDAGNGSAKYGDMTTNGIKLRANRGSITIDGTDYYALVINVQDNTTITSFKYVGYTNNKASDAKYVNIKGLYVDDDVTTNLLTQDYQLPYSDEKKAVTIPTVTLSATKNITLVIEVVGDATQYFGEFTIGYTKEKVTQEITAATFNGEELSASDLETLKTDKALTIDGSALNGVGNLGITLNSGATDVTRAFSGSNIVYTFTINSTDTYTVTVTGVTRTYEAEAGSVAYYSKDGAKVEGADGRTVTANGIELTMVADGKVFQYGSGSVTLGDVKYVPLKLSTGSGVNVTFPEGKKAVKATVYGWSVSGNGKLPSIKESAESDKAVDSSNDIFYATNTAGDIYPSVYEYELDNWESFYFTAVGSASQPFVVIDFEFADEEALAEEEESEDEAIIRVSDTDVTDGTYYYKLYVSKKAIDYSLAMDDEWNSYGKDPYGGLFGDVDEDGFKAFVVSSKSISFGNSKVSLTQVDAVPANTPVLIRVKEPNKFTVAAVESADPVDNLLTVAESDATLNPFLGDGVFGGTLGVDENGNVVFQSDWSASLSAGDIYLSLTEEDLDATYGGDVALAYGEIVEEVATANNIAELATASGLVNLTLFGAKVTYANEIEDFGSYIDYVVIEDESGAYQIYSYTSTPGLASKVKTGDILYGTLHLNIMSLYGATVTTVNDLDSFDDEVLAVAGTVEPTQVTDTTDDSFLETINWRYVTLKDIATTAVEAEGYYDIESYNGLSTEDLLGDNAVIQDDFELLYDGYDDFPIELGGNVDATGFLIYLGTTLKFQPTAITTPVTIGEAGVATFSSANRLDFSASEKIAAYIATVDGTTVTFKQVKQVPANTGVLLRSVDGGAVTEDVSVVVATPDATEGNALVASDGSSVEGKYILANGANGIGFYKAGATNTLAAGKAYLDVPAEVRFIGLNGETTGISEVQTAGEAQAVYNLQGQRVVKAVKGLNIIGGKKVLVK